MSRKFEILRKAEELERQKRETQRQRRAERPYDGKGMDCSKMPLGCWFWLILFAVVVVYGFAKLIHGVQ